MSAKLSSASRKRAREIRNKIRWPNMSYGEKRRVMYEVINDIDNQYTEKELRKITRSLHETQKDRDDRMEVMISNHQEMERLRFTSEKKALFDLCNDIEKD